MIVFVNVPNEYSLEAYEAYYNLNSKNKEKDPQVLEIQIIL